MYTPELNKVIQVFEGKGAYFKSTDGHYNNWSFNLRRPNIHLLEIIHQNHGCAIFFTAEASSCIDRSSTKGGPCRLNQGWQAYSGRSKQDRAHLVCSGQPCHCYQISGYQPKVRCSVVYTPWCSEPSRAP